MNGHKLAAVLVAVVMLGAFGYMAWTSRQVARAQDEIEPRRPTRSERVEQAIQEVELDMRGGGR